MKETTLAEWGTQLPIGVEQDDTLHRELAFRPYTGQIVQAMGHWRKQIAQDKTIPAQGFKREAHEVLQQLALLLTRFGPHEHTLVRSENGAMEADPAFMGNLRQAAEGDVMFAHVASRMVALGDEYGFHWECPRCKWEGPTPFPLGEMGVTVLESAEERHSWYKLRHPIESSRPEFGQIHSLLLTPPPFEAMLDPNYMANMELGVDTLAALQRCVVGVNLQDDDTFATYTLSPKETMLLNGFDLVQLEKKLADWIGLDFSFKTFCPGEIDGKPCDAPIHNLVNWYLGNFFRDSILLAT